MKNIVKKSLFVVISCWMTVALTATEVVALAPVSYTHLTLPTILRV